MSTFLALRKPATKAPPNTVQLVAGKNLLTGERDFRRHFKSVSSIEQDLFLLASAVFAVDRAVPRGEREDVCRELALTVQVTNIAQFLPYRETLVELLRTLSHDLWRVEFVPVAGAPSDGSEVEAQVQGRTLLFSGGLDSLAAALEQGANAPTCLVSHRTHNHNTVRAQDQLVNALANAGSAPPHYAFFVSSKSDKARTLVHDEENSQRTRSFVFLALAALVARRTGHREIVFLAENGPMAIHLPLSAARVGAFTTQTAHPKVLALAERLLGGVLGLPLRIRNPYTYLTKAEVVARIVRSLPTSIVLSNSCWMNARLPADQAHCGKCVPCFMRRIAIETHGPDPTRYFRDVWAEDVSRLPVEDDGRRNIADLGEFVLRMSRSTDEEIKSDWPELISEHFDMNQAVEMYRRFAGEALRVLNRYPTLRAFVS